MQPDGLQAEHGIWVDQKMESSELKKSKEQMGTVYTSNRQEERTVCIIEQP